MGIALVSAGTPSLTATPAFGQPTASGNLLTCWLFSNNPGATFSDSLTGTGWTLAASGGQAFVWASLWYRASSSAGETAPAVSSGGSVYYARLAEYSGAATTTPLDSSGGNGGTGAQTQTATNTASDAAAGDLILSCSGWNGGNTGGVVSVTMADSAGASVTPAVASATNGTGFYVGLAWGLAGSTGASKDTATGTISVFSNGAGAIASFLAAAGTPAPAGSVQSRATVPVPRRYPARAGKWATAAGPGNNPAYAIGPPAVIRAGGTARLTETYRLVSG